MSLFDSIHAEYVKVKDALEAKFGHEVGTEAAALLDTAKAQAKTVVEDAAKAGQTAAGEALAGLKADAGTVAADVAKATTTPTTVPTPPSSGAPSAS